MKNKWRWLISSLVILFPAFIGLFLWHKIPEYITIHWNINGTADGYGSRWFLLWIPLMLFGIHTLCLWITKWDNERKNQDPKMIRIVYWIIPVISLYVNGIVYAAMLGMEIDITLITGILCGLGLVVIGNYMPKCKQNTTLGIKLKWTLANEENWNATHRFAGIVWFFGGLIIMLAAFLPEKLFAIAFVILLFAIAMIPTVYSYLYYRKQLTQGNVTKKDFQFKPDRKNKIMALVACVIVVLTLLFCFVVTFTADMQICYTETAFTIQADFYPDLTVEYSDIERIEWVKNDTVGKRTNGYGSPKLQMGNFQNEIYGNYTRYSFTDCSTSILLVVNGKTLIINGADTAQTNQIYETISARIQP